MMIFIYSLVTIRRNVTIGMVTMRWDETFDDAGEKEVAVRDLNNFGYLTCSQGFTSAIGSEERRI
jgi:hypothetical protein